MIKRLTRLCNHVLGKEGNEGAKGVERWNYNNNSPKR